MVFVYFNAKKKRKEIIFLWKEKTSFLEKTRETFHVSDNGK